MDVFFKKIVFLFLIGQICTQDANVTYNITEERPVKTYIGSVALNSLLFTNISNAKFQRLQFQLLKEGNKYGSYFQLDANTSMLWTSKVIDREQLSDCFATCIIDLIVAVYDLDLSEMIKIIHVVINIIDINDNSPVFEYVKSPIQISESASIGTIIVSGIATDLDKGIGNNVQMYELVQEQNTFELNTTVSDENNLEFMLILKNSLDREKDDVYRCIILAKDGGLPQLTGTLFLDITVTDENDNSPVFSSNIYNISIPENSPINSSILTLTATDADAGVNGEITFKFSNHISLKIATLFLLNPSTGNLTIQGSVDYETDKEFIFQVLACDNGIVPNLSTATVQITVTDVNDNAPIININQPPGGTVLSELAEANSFVAHMEVRDLDGGKNGQVACIIPNNYFMLQYAGIANNFKILLNRSLDYETEQSLNVTIICTDMGDIPLESYVEFVVHVEDVNDHAPVFLQSVYNTSIKENNEAGVDVLKVSATDMDSGRNAQISYSLSSESNGLFSVNPFTGIISVNVSLDREKLGDQIFLYVFATDDGVIALTSSATVVINILDQNDNAPVFAFKSFRFHVIENLPVGTTVGNISASDPDKDLNGIFNFQFQNNSNILEDFQISTWGLIKTNKILDREQIKFYNFYVEAVDMDGRSSSAQVTVTVDDVNDNFPQIIYPHDNTINIFDSLPLHSEVIQIVAEDADAGENAHLYYYIKQDNSSNNFDLNVTSGKMFINTTLSQKDIGTIFSLVLCVKDGGSPALVSWTSLYINIVQIEPQLSSRISGSQSNIFIAVGITIFTAVSSTIIITIIIKIYWINGRKGTGNPTDGVTESIELDPRLINPSSSFSSNSTLSVKYTGNDNLKDLSYQNMFSNNLNENGYIFTIRNTVGNSYKERCVYLDDVTKTDFNFKMDEANSDNFCEQETRDSGQGSSDIDIKSQSELPLDDFLFDGSPSLPKSNFCSTFENFHSDHYHGNMSSTSAIEYRSLGNSDQNADNLPIPQSLASFIQIPTKTAEKKELSKLRSQKRVMFSDDLENSQSSGISSTMSTQSHADQSSTIRYSDKLQGMSSVDNSKSWDGIHRASDWLHRSLHNNNLKKNCNHIYNQLPSNQIKFIISKDFKCRPLASNIKGYLDKVMMNAHSQNSPRANSHVFSATDSFQSVVNSDVNDTMTTVSGSYVLFETDSSPDN